MKAENLLKYILFYLFSIFITMPLVLLAMPLAILGAIMGDKEDFKNYMEFFKQIIKPIETYKKFA